MKCDTLSPLFQFKKSFKSYWVLIQRPNAFKGVYCEWHHLGVQNLMVCFTPFRGQFRGVWTRVGGSYVWEWTPGYKHCQYIPNEAACSGLFNFTLCSMWMFNQHKHSSIYLSNQCWNHLISTYPIMHCDYGDCLVIYAHVELITSVWCNTLKGGTYRLLAFVDIDENKNFWSFCKDLCQ